MEDHFLSAVRDCLFNTFAATLNTGGRWSFRNRRMRHAVVTGKHLAWQIAFYFSSFWYCTVPTKTLYWPSSVSSTFNIIIASCCELNELTTQYNIPCFTTVYTWGSSTYVCFPSHGKFPTACWEFVLTDGLKKCRTVLLTFACAGYALPLKLIKRGEVRCRQKTVAYLKFRCLITRCLGYYSNLRPGCVATCSSPWPRGLRRGNASARLLGLSVRIPSDVCCQVEVSASGWSLVKWVLPSVVCVCVCEMSVIAEPRKGQWPSIGSRCHKNKKVKLIKTPISLLAWKIFIANLPTHPVIFSNWNFPDLTLNQSSPVTT